jgi:hypothetical protein
MSGALAELGAVVEASFGALGDETPERRLERLELELSRCFEALSAEHDRASAPWDELALLADAFRDRSRLLPDAESRAHFDWWRRTSGAYKPVLGSDGRLQAPELPAGVLSVPLALVPSVYRRIRELAYELHRREQPSECDCAALIASRIERKPRAPALTPLGETNDGYYFGTAFECSSCKTRWFCGEMDDDSNGVFWAPEVGP